ncbi:MAG: ABC transporter permease, partial [Christensenellales bacterium]
MVEAAKLNHIDTPVDEEFQIVGAGYKIHTPEFRKPMVRDKLRGKPIASIIILSFIAFGCICAGLFANHDPNGFYLTNLDSAPGGEFFFGTDSLGRDIYSMIWYGGRVSLVVGLLGAAIIAVIGVIYGSIAGTSNTKVESAMMRAVEICGSIPTILFTLIVSATIQANNVISLSFVIGIVGWFSLARIVRSEVRQIRNGEYVLYARSCGGKFLYVMKQHLLPNFLSAIMFVVISSVSTCIT